MKSFFKDIVKWKSYMKQKNWDEFAESTKLSQCYTLIFCVRVMWMTLIVLRFFLVRAVYQRLIHAVC